MTPPLAPRRVSWAIAGRVVRGVAVAFMLVWLVALVAWPVRWRFEVYVGSHWAEGGWLVMPAPRAVAGDGCRWRLDASLSLLPELLGM